MKLGFTLIELLVVIGILGILLGIVVVSVTSVRADAFNTRIISDVRQLRTLAESAYDASAASYKNWSAAPSIQNEIAEVTADLTDAHGAGAGAAYVIADTEEKEYCVSAPLHVRTGGYYCVDQSGVFKTTTAECPTVAPLLCP